MQGKSRDRFAAAALAAATNRRKHGEDFYKKISSMGGRVRGTNKGFAANRELAKLAGRKGGQKSKKGKIMAGTSAGGKKAAAKNLAKNPNFYREIGRIGGRAGKGGGFASGIVCNCDTYPDEHALQKCAGRRGGRTSKPGMRKKKG